MTSSAHNSLIPTILNNDSFLEIETALKAVQDHEGSLSSTDPCLISLLLLQMSAHQEKQAEKQSKLEAVIQKMQEMSQTVEQYNQIANKRMNWISSELNQLQESKGDIEQDINILKNDGKHSQSFQPSSSGNPIEQQAQLNQILAQFECKNAFPKNKTEALMLINQVQMKIQQIQMQKVSSYDL